MNLKKVSENMLMNTNGKIQKWTILSPVLEKNKERGPKILLINRKE